MTKGETWARSRTKQIAVVILATVLAATGCGNSKEGSVASIESVPTTPGGLPDEPARGKDGRGRGVSGPRGSRRGDTPSSRARQSDGRGPSPAPGAQPPASGASPLQRTVALAMQQRPRAQRDQYVKSTTLIVFAGFGLGTRRVTLDSAGTGVRAVMASREACSATADTEDNITRTIRTAIPWVRSVEVIVGPAGERLSRYVRRRCQPPRLPSGGAGRVVLKARGVGLRDTAQFTVRARRWSIEYLNGARELHVLVLQNGHASGGTVDAARRGPGRRTFSGAGRFSLRIASSGEWVVRVRDGG